MHLFIDPHFAILYNKFDSHLNSLKLKIQAITGFDGVCVACIQYSSDAWLNYIKTKGKVSPHHKLFLGDDEWPDSACLCSVQ